jgi:hypothetical protein
VYLCITLNSLKVQLARLLAAHRWSDKPSNPWSGDQALLLHPLKLFIYS